MCAAFRCMKSRFACEKRQITQYRPSQASKQSHVTSRSDPEFGKWMRGGLWLQRHGTRRDRPASTGAPGTCFRPSSVAVRLQQPSPSRPSPFHQRRCVRETGCCAAHIDCLSLHTTARKRHYCRRRAHANRTGHKSKDTNSLRWQTRSTKGRSSHCRLTRLRNRTSSSVTA